MRRKDREITDINRIKDIIKKCDVCRVAFNDDEVPYIIPFNFGADTDGERIKFYFHGAKKGYKYKLIEKNNQVCFEMDCSHELVTDDSKGYCTMKYESIIGRGYIEILPDEEKLQALNKIMAQYHEEEFKFKKSAIKYTNILCLTVEKITAKSNIE